MCKFFTADLLAPRTSVMNIMSCFASRIVVAKCLTMGQQICSDHIHVLHSDACDSKEALNTPSVTQPVLPSGFCGNALCCTHDICLKVLSCLLRLSSFWRQRLAAKDVHPEIVDDHVVVADLGHGHCHKLRFIVLPLEA